MSDEVVGLLPAAGRASRVAPIHCSKEIYPVASGTDCESVPACKFLLDAMSEAGVNRSYVIIREDKRDIPECLGDGNNFGLNLAYITISQSSSTARTLNHAQPFIQNARVVMGFPDILFRPVNAFSRMLTHLSYTRADIVLGLFNAELPSKMDMVDIDSTGRVLDIVIKPESTSLVYTWILAAWTPTFSNYMNEYLNKRTEGSIDSDGELYVGSIIQSAINDGLSVVSVMFENGRYLDIGTPEDLQRAAYFSYVRQ